MARRTTAWLLASVLAVLTCLPALGGGSAVAAVACTPTTDQPVVTIANPSVTVGGVLQISGTGWCHPTDGGSVIAVKLDEGAYSHLDASVHANLTIWAIVEANAADGTFAATITLPDGTPQTSQPAFPEGSHTLRLLTGSLKPEDAVRTVQSAPFVVSASGTATPTPTPTPTPSSSGTCQPTSATPTVTLDENKAALGSLLRITGAGWCHPTSGGSVIAVKLDDGAYSHLDSSVNANRTVWAIVQADESDGTFVADVRLPDGTEKTSTPAFPKGQHTLRLLTGTLKAGDTIRTVQSDPFVVGKYKPTGTPDPLNDKLLKPGKRKGVTATKSANGKRLVVKVPKTPVGSWVYASVYAADGSPRYPWKKWYRLGKSHRLDLKLAGKGLTGQGRVVIQSGQADEVGRLLGWVKVRFTKPAGQSGPSTDTSQPGDPTPGGGVPPDSAPGTEPNQSAPEVEETSAPPAPAPPLTGYTDLDPARHGTVTGRVEGGVVTLKVRSSEPGDLVYVHVYTPEGEQPLGWAALDERRQVRVDLSGLGVTYAGVTVQDEAGRLMGWAPVALSSQPASSAPAPASTPLATSPVTPAAPPATTTASATGESSWDTLIGTTDGLLLVTGALVLTAAAFRSGPRHATPRPAP